MRRVPLPVAVFLGVLLSACASTGDLASSGRERYLQLVDEERMVTTSAARHLRRRVLGATSDAIKPGLYTPSELEHLLAGGCQDGGSVNGALMALSNHRFADFGHAQDIDPFGTLPRDVTPIESLNRRARQGSDDLPPVTGSGGTQRALQCPMPAQYHACTRAAANRPRPASTLAVRDLDFVVYVSDLETERCRRAHDAAGDAARPRRRDVMLPGAALRQKAADLAEATYPPEDLLRLVQLLPAKYSEVTAPVDEMPLAMRLEVERIHAAALADARKAFAPAQLPETIVTFKREQAPPPRGSFWTALFRRWAAPRWEEIYIGPALARAPFYLCYDKGAFQNVIERYDLLNSLPRDTDTPWLRGPSSKQIDDRAARQQANEARYKQCLTEQFYFLMSREIAHLAVKGEGRPAAPTEVKADCLGFITTRRSTGFGLGVFSTLALPGSQGSAPELPAMRSELLARLATHFSTAPLPPTGAEALQFCGAWADQHAPAITQQGGA